MGQPPSPRCAHCGLLITIWQLVKCSSTGGHQARHDVGVTVPCAATGCTIPAGHHGTHSLGEPPQ